MTSVEFSVEVDAPPQAVWEVTSKPENLPHWDRHIVTVRVPPAGLRAGTRYEVEMGFMTIRTIIHATVLEWEAPWRAKIHLSGLLEATVTTSIAALPFDRSVLRHEIYYRFRGLFGGIGAASLNAVGGAGMALRHGVLAQKHEIEERIAR
jgi:ligand-binding SRPBCC domain-containing protein